MREDRQLELIINIISGYGGREPLSRYLKNYFNAHREMGSRDRRQAADLIYNYFRIGKAIAGRSMEERIAAGNYICGDGESAVVKYCVSKFLKGVAAGPVPSVRDSQIKLNERIAQIQSIYPDFRVDDVFPYSKHVTDKIDKDAFILSFLEQPKLWIRVRRKFLKEVTDELTNEKITFEAELENPQTLSMSTHKVDKLKSFEKGYFEIQDWSSQQTVNYFRPKVAERWWDACAGSGGKSLLLYEAEPTIHLTVSDSRESILTNLRERFRKVQMRSYETLLADLTNLKPETLNFKQYDGIIADVPCTGSGTWSRSPEWLSMFEEKSIERFAALQKKIVSNVIPYLKKDSPLIYITCSVFKEENEMMVEWMKKELQLKVEEMDYLKGYERGGDTMFVTRMMKLYE